MKHFRSFFQVEQKGSCTGVAGDSMEAAVMFFIWYYHVTFLRPFIHNMPFLYPDSSAILHRVKKAAPRTWLKLLEPADATPVISKHLYQMLVNAGRNEFFGELEVAAQKGAIVSERAEYYLLAMQTAIRGQDNLDLEEAQNQRLIEVRRSIDVLLRRKSSGSGAMVPSSLNFASGTRWQIQEAAAKQIVHQIGEMHTIQVETMQKLFTDLAAVTEFGVNSGAQNMTVVLLHVFRTLKEKGELQRFYAIMDGWKNLARHGIEVVIAKVAKLVLSNQEVRSSRSF